jgi:hypothetical protein
MRVPILRRAKVYTLGRRNARKGVGQPWSWLKVRANPPGNGAPAKRSDRPKRGRAKQAVLEMAYLLELWGLDGEKIR